MSPDMEFVKFLGKGKYGSVDLYGYQKDDGSMIYNAMKSSDVEKYDSLNKEFQILTKLKGCPRVVQVLGNSLVEGTNLNGDRVFMMPMEYGSGGTLDSFIQANKSKLSDSIIKDLTRMILQGLVSIHGLGFVHCDLKPDNLLLCPRDDDDEEGYYDYVLKIADFGVSTKAGEESDIWDFDAPWVGTHIYMSPESVQESKVEKTLDLWSLGCVVLEMCTGTCPWYGLSKDQVECKLMYDEAPEIPESVSCDARRFIEKCFARKPEERGTASELLLHPFFIEDQKMAVVERKVRSRKVAKKSKDMRKKPLKVVSPHFKKTSKKLLKGQESSCSIIC